MVAGVDSWLSRSPLLLVLCASSVGADSPVLHEYIPDIRPAEAALALAQAAGEPAGIENGGELIQAPEPGPAAAQGPAMVATPGDGQAQEEPGKRSPTYRPDRQTELEGTLDYYGTFNPAIAPFKRVTTLDMVALARDGLTPVLGISEPAREAVPVEGADAPPPDNRPRDRFWGDVTLDFSSGRVVPLPSVAPESRILTLRAEPAVELRVERDTADNFFAVLSGELPAQRVRLVFLTDAPRGYFGRAIPEVPADALARKLTPLPGALRARARRFAAELGLRPGVDLRRALRRLTEHFRSFEESARPPDDTGDIYLDLARGKKGVCRHRAYAFMVTAQGLGIPTRFVQNEAHSWVEVELPGTGFMRIDLGGAANGLRAHDSAQRSVYQPVEPDRLPRPQAYEESYSQLRGRVSGLRRPGFEELTGRWVSPEPSPPTQAQGAGPPASRILSGPSSRAPRERSQRTPLRIEVDQRTSRVLRGRSLKVSGRVADGQGRGKAGMRVEVSLAAQGRRDRLLLGVTVSGAGGRFEASFGVPPDLAPGDYGLTVITPGDARHLPAIAR